jgi:hypothetical protein
MKIVPTFSESLEEYLKRAPGATREDWSRLLDEAYVSQRRTPAESAAILQAAIEKVWSGPIGTS